MSKPPQKNRVSFGREGTICLVIYNAIVLFIAIALVRIGVTAKWDEYSWIGALVVFLLLGLIDYLLVLYYKRNDKKQRNTQNSIKAPTHHSKDLKKKSEATYQTQRNVDGNEALLLAEELFEKMVSMKLDKYLIREYIPKEYLTDDDLKSANVEAKCSVICCDILKFLDLPPLPFVKLTVNNITSQPKENKAAVPSKGTAGQYSNSQDGKHIIININKSSTPNTVMATICHECTHFFMDKHGLKTKIESINEKRTDVLAVILGFGDIMIQGYRVNYTYEQLADSTRTTTSTLGYISQIDCINVIEAISERREKFLNNKAETENFKKSIIEGKQKLASSIDTAERLNTMFQDIIKNIGFSDFEKVQAIYYDYEAIDYEKQMQVCKNALAEEKALSNINNAAISCSIICERILRLIKRLQAN